MSDIKVYKINPWFFVDIYKYLIKRQLFKYDNTIFAVYHQWDDYSTTKSKWLYNFAF